MTKILQIMPAPPELRLVYKSVDKVYRVEPAVGLALVQDGKDTYVTPLELTLDGIGLAEDNLDYVGQAWKTDIEAAIKAVEKPQEG